MKWILVCIGILIVVNVTALTLTAALHGDEIMMLRTKSLLYACSIGLLCGIIGKKDDEDGKLP